MWYFARICARARRFEFVKCHFMHFASFVSVHVDTYEYYSFLSMHTYRCIVYYSFLSMHMYRCIVYYSFLSMHTYRCIVYYSFLSMHTYRCIVYYSFLSMHTYRCIVYYKCQLRCVTKYCFTSPNMLVFNFNIVITTPFTAVLMVSPYGFLQQQS